MQALISLSSSCGLLCLLAAALIGDLLLCVTSIVVVCVASIVVVGAASSVAFGAASFKTVVRVCRVVASFPLLLQFLVGTVVAL